MSAPLYELTGRYRQLMDATVDWETGEVNEDNVPGFAAILAGLEGELKDKLDGCAKMVKMMDADMAALKVEETRLSKRRKSIDGNKKHLKGYMRGCLDTAGLTNVKTRLFTIYTTSPQDKLDITDEEAIPKEYRKEAVEPPPDNALIKQALQDEKIVEGARLIKGDAPLVIR